jgi:hypothetical protein
MRRWVCIVAMLAGFVRSDVAWTWRPRLPVAIERPIDPDRLDPLEAATRLLTRGDWWATR